MTDLAYPARHTKRRRATKAEMAERAEMLTFLAERHGPCSVRHLFYASVVAGMPGITKDDAGYDKVQRQVLMLRRSGDIAYESVVDSTRWMRKPRSYGSAADALEATARLYRRNLWSSSPYRVEVWAESDSIASTIYDVTAEWDVPLMVTRGQSSETFAYNAADAWIDGTQQPVVLYVGDHDPAGLDIEESLRSKLTGFYEQNVDVRPEWLPERLPEWAWDDPDDECWIGVNARVGWAEPIRWQRIGVTWQQAEELDLPGTPPKLKGRRKPYPYPMAVEAEALPAPLLRELLNDAISDYVDHDQLDVLKAAEESERTVLMRMAGGLMRLDGEVQR